MIIGAGNTTRKLTVRTQVVALTSQHVVTKEPALFCIDKVGRICTCGKQFVQADRVGTNLI